jgi:hypothetical protein
MAKVNQIEKKALVSNWNCVKFQILTHCFLNDVQLSPAEIEFLTLLGIEQESEISTFCVKAFEKNIYKSPQSVRNALAKLEKMNLVTKDGINKKKISLNNIPVLSTGNILLNYKILSVEAN